jgi:hypothetical protein
MTMLGGIECWLFRLRSLRGELPLGCGDEREPLTADR